MKNIWLISFDEFKRKQKTINNKLYADDYFSLGKKHCIGVDYYLYVSSDLETMNPYTKKDSKKEEIKSFRSSSAIDVKEQAYLFILKEAEKIGLFEENVCDKITAKNQITYIRNNEN